MLDYVIKGGLIVDGSGRPGFRADVGIEKDIITCIGEDLNLPCRKVLSAEGLVVCPGFIDMHAHSDWWALAEPALLPKVRQGITTELVGQDGFSLAPWPAEQEGMLRRLIAGMHGNPSHPVQWQSMAGYLDAVRRARPSTNLLSLVGHGTLRVAAMGMAARPANAAEMDHMRGLLRTAMEEGAVGLSAGMIYAPCSFAGEDELSALCRVVAEYDGLFVVHLRSEGDRLLEAIDEVVRIAQESGVALHISHFKVFGRSNWGNSLRALEKLEEAHARGIDVSFDQYPYTAGSTGLIVLLPPWANEGGTDAILERLYDPAAREQIAVDMLADTSWDNFLYAVGPENIVITWVGSERNAWAVGKNLLDISAIMNESVVEAVMDLLLEEELAVSMVDFCMSEEDVETIMTHPLGMFCTDGILSGMPHPRVYGTYPRILGRYVREKGLLSLEEAVHKMTGRPAARLRLPDRGLVRAGYRADLVLFDPEEIWDTATFEAPHQFPRGIAAVFVNGQLTVDCEGHTGTRAGRPLRFAETT